MGGPGDRGYVVKKKTCVSHGGQDGLLFLLKICVGRWTVRLYMDTTNTDCIRMSHTRLCYARVVRKDGPRTIGLALRRLTLQS